MTAVTATVQYNTDTNLCLNTCFFQIQMNQYCDSWNSSVEDETALIQAKFSNIHNFKAFGFFSLIPEKMGRKFQNKWWLSKLPVPLSVLHAALPKQLSILTFDETDLKTILDQNRNYSTISYKRKKNHTQFCIQPDTKQAALGFQIYENMLTEIIHNVLKVYFMLWIFNSILNITRKHWCPWMNQKMPRCFKQPHNVSNMAFSC